jgi:hypothetical protein
VTLSKEVHGGTEIDVNVIVYLANIGADIPDVKIP